jgi:hypothetical protein
MDVDYGPFVPPPLRKRKHSGKVMSYEEKQECELLYGDL